MSEDLITRLGKIENLIGNLGLNVSIDMDGILSDLTKTDIDLDDRIRKLEERVSKIEELMSEYREDVVDMNKRLEEIETSIRNLNDTFTLNNELNKSVLAVVNRLEDSQRAFGEKIDRIECNIDRLDNETVKLKNDTFKVLLTVTGLGSAAGFLIADVINSDIAKSILSLFGM